MNFYTRRFNIILQFIVILILAVGCVTGKKADKNLGVLRLYIESAGNVLDSSRDVSVLRSEPLLVTIAAQPVLTEANIVAAKLLENDGGFAVEVKFDEVGGRMLEQYASSNPGKHFVVFGQWDEKKKDGRWLAAPLISHRIADNTLVFSPDASRAEASLLVEGLNRTAKKNAKTY